MKQILKGAGCIVLFIIVFLVSLVALDFITKNLRLIDWHTSFEAMSALGAVLIPLAVVYIETNYLIYFLLLTGKQRKQAISKNFLRFDCFYGIPCLC